MQAASFIRLFSLAAIWGAPFLFMRIAVGTLGPAALMTEGVNLLLYFWENLLGGLVKKHQLDLKNKPEVLLLLGFFNSALPFLIVCLCSSNFNSFGVICA